MLHLILFTLQGSTLTFVPSSKNFSNLSLKGSFTCPNSMGLVKSWLGLVEFDLTQNIGHWSWTSDAKTLMQSPALVNIMAISFRAPAMKYYQSAVLFFCVKNFKLCIACCKVLLERRSVISSIKRGVPGCNVLKYGFYFFM